MPLSNASGKRDGSTRMNGTLIAILVASGVLGAVGVSVSFGDGFMSAVGGFLFGVGVGRIAIQAVGIGATSLSQLGLELLFAVVVAAAVIGYNSMSGGLSRPDRPLALFAFLALVALGLSTALDLANQTVSNV